MRLEGDWMGADKMHQVKDIMALALRFRVVFYWSCRRILSAWIQWMQTMNQIEYKGCRQCTAGWSRLAKVRASGRWVTGAADSSPLTLKEVRVQMLCIEYTFILTLLYLPALWSRCETGDVDCWEWNGTWRGLSVKQLWLNPMFVQCTLPILPIVTFSVMWLATS